MTNIEIMPFLTNLTLVKHYNNFNKAKGTRTMKKYAIVFVLAAAFSSCSDDPPALLTPDLVSVAAYDLANNGNASDIRVDFGVKDNLNVFEYRVMVVASASSGAFDEGIAESVPDESYFLVQPEVFEEEYLII